MHERLEGQGRLESSQQPEKVYEVVYQFDIVTDVVERPGFPPVVGNSHSRGTIRSVDGEPIPEGYYQLHASDGEIIRVKHLTLGTWVILAPR
jgi:hypothetical protein